MTDAAGSETWTYDVTGQVCSDQRTTNGVSKNVSYAYNLDGSLKTLTYPTGRVITYTPGGAGRPLSAVDLSGPVNYATVAHYSPAGSLSSLTNGAGIASAHVYNNRLQPCWMYATTAAALSATANCSDTAAAGNILDLKYDFALGTADNGNVKAITNNRDATRSQSFSYDALNRLATAQTSSTTGANCWGESFGYDPWGNLYAFGVNPATQSAYNGCTQESGLATSATARNQLAGYCYDAAGNLVLNATCPTGSFNPTYSYNAEGQLASTAGVTYTYDGDGKRVKKSNGTLYWYGMGSDTLDESDASGNITNEYVFFGGQRIAKRDSSGNLNFYFADHLGTSRVVTNSAGAVLDDSDFYPFGGERPITSSSGNHYKFTGKERDSESGLDNFGARYDSSSLGRFMSPDIGAFHLENPQSLNRYAYALNNPLFYVDLDGEDSMSAVYRLGTASVNTFAESGQRFDSGVLLASLAGPSIVPLSSMEQNQSMISGGSWSFSRSIPFPNAAGGGCVLGCSTVFNTVPVGISLSLSFSYDDKSGQITSANIQASIDTSAAFIGPNPPARRVAFQPLPGITPGPEVFSVNINSGVLRKLTPAQLQALMNATSKSNPINDAIRQAVLQEQQRRAEEQRKKEEEERKKKCQQDGKKDCA